MQQPLRIALLTCALSCVWPGDVQAQLAGGDPATQFSLTTWLAAVNAATDIAFLPGGRAVGTRKTGEVALVGADGTLLMPMAFRFQVDTGSEKGLLGVVADAADNLYFYASTGTTNEDKHRVYKGK